MTKRKIRTQAFPPASSESFERPFYHGEDGKFISGYDPCLVDSSDHESLKSIVERCIRTGDLSGVKTSVPVFEVGDGDDPSVAVQGLPIHRQRGFDIVDGHNFIEETKRKARAEIEANRKLKDGSLNNPPKVDLPGGLSPADVVPVPGDLKKS